MALAVQGCGTMVGMPIDIKGKEIVNGGWAYDFQQIREFCSQENMVDLLENYSGRFMYGNTCIGFTVNPQNLFMAKVRLAEYLINNGISKGIDIVNGCSQDELGLDYIIYFPHIYNRS